MHHRSNWLMFKPSAMICNQLWINLKVGINSQPRSPNTSSNTYFENPQSVWLPSVSILHYYKVTPRKSGHACSKCMCTYYQYVWVCSSTSIRRRNHTCTSPSGWEGGPRRGPACFHHASSTELIFRPQSFNGAFQKMGILFSKMLLKGWIVKLLSLLSYLFFISVQRF